MNVSIEDEGGYAMTSWTRNDLERIGAADELLLVSFKKDGTHRKPIPIWVVRVADDLYVRAYRGHETAWFRHVQQRHEGRIGAGGVTKDVMGTGHYAALLAGVHPGGTVAIIGDGAVGLCGVLAARRLGAERIILLGHQESRLSLGRRFGATDLVTSRGEQAEQEVIELTKGGAESVMECVGSKESMDTAIAIARPGGSIGYVGVPHGSEQINLLRLFFNHIALRGGGHLFGLFSLSCSRMCWPDGSILLLCSISPSISTAFHRATRQWISAQP